jgi:hypothetical protein
MTRKQGEVEAGLVRKGFRETVSHHRYFIYHTEAGLKSKIKTKTSHGGRELDDWLLGQMAKQCGVSKKDFLDLVDCPLSQTEYEKKVTESL